MRTLDEYLKLPYRMEIVEDSAEGGYVVSFPELPGCISCGNTIDTAFANAEDAKREWLTAALEEGISMNQYCVYLLSKNDMPKAHASC